MQGISSNPVAIIGIGCMFPKSADARAYWATIVNGVDAIAELPAGRWRAEDYFAADPKAPDRTYSTRGGFLEPADFPPLDFGITPNTLEGIDTTQLLGLLAARQALDDAGYGQGGKPFDRGRASVILGITGTLELVIPLGARLGHPIWRRALQEAGVAADVAEDVVQRIADGYVPWIEDSFPGLLGNVVAGRIANRLDLGGTNCVVDAACASSLSALHLALLELAEGRSDLVLSGGFDTFNDIFMFMCFSKTPALSPTGDARPFDRAGDGTILGEGLGCVVLKRLADAERDGDKIYAVIKGIGTSSDGKGQAIYAPSPAGQMRALREAYQRAGVTPDTVELVEAHGTGTKAGDAAELTALAEVYRGSGREGAWCALGSVKSQIGHTKAAAGAAGLVKAALALHHKVLPPTIKVSEPIDQAAPGMSPFYVNTQKRPWLPARDHPRRAAVSAFGFGGSNFHCVLEEYPGAKPAIDWDGDAQIVAFSAATADELWKKVDAFAATAGSEMRLEAACSRHAFNAGDGFRLVLAVEKGKTDLPRLLAGVRSQRDQQAGKTSWSTPDGAFFGSGPVDGQLAFLFPGQGSQYVGMLRDLACQFPQVQEALAEANAAGDGRLSDSIYPHPAFRDDERQRQEQALRATDVAQPALGAVSLGALRVLDHFGVRPDAVAGHSFGELAALCAAGRLDGPALHALSRQRGRLMAEGTGDRGAMLAVAAPAGQVEELLREQRLDLVIANKNAPGQVVLSGLTAEIDRANAVLGGRGLRTHRLPVAAAFHSPLVAEVRGKFLAALADFAFAPAQVPVFANTTGQTYPDDPVAARELLAGQLARPVEFVAQIEAMHAAGARTFVEVGPSNKLTGLVGAILAGRDHVAISVDASAGQRSGACDLARVLALLAARGHAADLKRWDDGIDPQKPIAKKPALTVPLTGANYVKPRPKRPPRPPAVLPPEPMKPQERNGTTANHVPPLAAPPPAADSFAAQALRATQENLAALQKLGEQTARLHGQFLEGQDRALQAIQSLLDQQRQLYQGGGPVLPSGARPSFPSIPAPAHGKNGNGTMPRTDREGEAPAAPGRQHLSNGHNRLPVSVEPARQEPRPPPARMPEPPRAEAARNGTAHSNGSPHILLEVVAEKTGYPVEMLQLDMELDADLGIDSIKRVEIFSAVQEKLPDAPAIKPEHLGTLRTLGNVVDFLASGGRKPPEGPESGDEAAVPPGACAPGSPVSDILLAVVAEKTGYPVEMLQPEMELDADLGIDSIKRVEIFSAVQERLPEAPAIKPEHLGTLRTLGQVSAFLSNGKHEAPTTNVAASLRDVEPRPTTNVAASLRDAESPPRSGGTTLQRLVLTRVPLDAEGEATCLPAGEVWVSGDDAGLVAGLSAKLEALGHPCRRISAVDSLEVPDRLAGLVVLAPAQGASDQFLADAFLLVQRCGPALRRAGGLLATVSRLDGAFGLNGLTGDGLSGGLAGLAKTAGHEWPEVRCRALDVAAAWADPDEAALALADELLRGGPVEVGLSSAGRCTLGLVETQADPGKPPLERGDVVLVTGGGRGVTAETAVALARTFAPTLIVLGRTPSPDTEPAWLAPLTSEGEIKRALAQRANGQATPRLVEDQYRTLSAERELRRNLRRIEEAGARVDYQCVDVRDPAAVAAVVSEVRRLHGPVRGLVHGAGVLADRRIEDKTLEQFQLVYDTKVAGLRHLLAVLPDLKVLAVFSSSTARWGRTGQADYAVANEALNKLCQAEARRRPGCKVVSLNWGPWDGGMVTPALRRVFEAEGVGVISLEAGAEQLVWEIAAAGREVEIVLLASGGRKPAVENEVPSSTKSTGGLPSTLAIVFERELSVETMPVLWSHVIAGRAVVPLALVAEWLAHAGLHSHPGLVFQGFNDLRIQKGIRLRQEQKLPVRVLAGKAEKDNGAFRVPVELRSDEGLHASAVICLGTGLSKAPAAMPLPAGTSVLGDFYRDVLFHGPDLQGIETVEACGEAGIAALVRAAPQPSEWLRQPLRSGWMADPLALDCALQMLILWCHETQGAGCLPSFVARYRPYQRSFPKDRLRVVARVTETAGAVVRADVDFVDMGGRLVARMEGVESVRDASLRQTFRENRLVPL